MKTKISKNEYQKHFNDYIDIFIEDNLVIGDAYNNKNAKEYDGVRYRVRDKHDHRHDILRLQAEVGADMDLVIYKTPKKAIDHFKIVMPGPFYERAKTYAHVAMKHNYEVID